MPLMLMKLRSKLDYLHGNNKLPLISAPGAYLILSIEVRCFKELGGYFKVREIIHTKSQNFVIFSFQIKINNCHYDI